MAKGLVIKVTTKGGRVYKSLVDTALGGEPTSDLHQLISSAVPSGNSISFDTDAGHIYITAAEIEAVEFVRTEVPDV